MNSSYPHPSKLYLVFQTQAYDRFDVGGLGEEVQRFQMINVVSRLQGLQILNKTVIVTGNVDDRFWKLRHHGFEGFWMETGAWWVEDQGIASDVFPGLIFGGAGGEGTEVTDSIVGSVLFGELDGVSIEFMSEDGGSALGAGDAKEAEATIQIKDRHTGLWLNPIENRGLELGSHARVRLEKRVGMNRVTNAVHFFC